MNETIGLSLSLPPMDEVNKVYVTEGHDVFKHIDGNRNISNPKGTLQHRR